MEMKSWLFCSPGEELRARVGFCSHARMDLLIVRKDWTTWLNFSTARQQNYSFVGAPEKSRSETFFLGEGAHA